MDIVNLSIAEVLTSLKTSEGGLAAEEADRRLREFGPNRIEEVKGKPLWLRFLAEFTHFFALILWVAAALAFFAEARNPGEGMGQLGVAMLAVIVVNGEETGCCSPAWRPRSRSFSRSSIRRSETRPSAHFPCRRSRG